MKRVITCAALVALFISMLVFGFGRVSGPRTATAQRSRNFHCTNGTISGKWGYHMEGHINGVGPIALVGGFTQTHDGMSTGSVTASFNGVIVKNYSFSGTFTTNDDCSGTGRLIDLNGVPILYDFVAVDGGAEMYLLNTDAGSTFNGVAKRID